MGPGAVNATSVYLAIPAQDHWPAGWLAPALNPRHCAVALRLAGKLG